MAEIEKAVDSNALTDTAHLALWYAAAELKGGRYAVLFRKTLARAREGERITDRDVHQWIAHGLIELQAHGLIELARNGEGVAVPVSIDTSRLVVGRILQGDWH